MSGAPPDRKMARIVRDTALGNFTISNERAMLFGPRGEVREVFAPGDPAFLAMREKLIRSKELSAVVYLNASQIKDVAQLALVEFFIEGKRSVHLLVVQAATSCHWSSVPEKELDQWIQTNYGKGDDEETSEKK